MTSHSRLLTQKPGSQDEISVLKEFFNFSNIGGATHWKFKNYFQFYIQELEIFQSHGYSSFEAVNLNITTHEGLRNCFCEIRKKGNATQTEIKQRLQAQYPQAGPLELQRSIELCMRLGFLLNVRLAKLESRGSPPLKWDEKSTVQELIDQRFLVSKWRLNASESRIHPLFTAAFMVKICGLKLEWTNCLSNHLFLDRKRNVLRIFPHKACLVEMLENVDWKARRNFAENASRIAAIPEEVLKETVWSLNLLFPHWDRASNEYLESNQQDFHRYPPYDGPSTLNLMEFNHWRDRLLEVYDVVFSSPPASWRQLLRDRRNPQQFWTFWIAIVILLLTIASTVASIMQVRYSGIGVAVSCTDRTVV